mmetsp:Transcript_23498/g.34649  ORF Transcript_23498/g.34649 Transcript_23498/m.34649 type:complete len:709 (+) Transcript_23498:430-2556(+)
MEHVASLIYTRGACPSVELESHVDINCINDGGVFVPVLPLLESPVEQSRKVLISLGKQRDNEEMSPLLPIEDINKFLSEQCRSLNSALKKLEDSFPPSSAQTLISAAEASLVLLSHHIGSIAEHYCNGVGYIEEMLRSQLVSAIGKEIQSEDFTEFILFHNRKLFKNEFVPKPFCHAIRRPGHYPDGVLSIERTGNGDFGTKKNTDPVVTFMRKIEGSSSAPMFFPINAATSVEFTGERFLHAWICHEFGEERESRSGGFNLVARARQFSSFLLLIGTVSGPDSFDPQHAIILQNKDEVLIPLLLNQLPTPKEFKDAIQSLSPEQQRFAKAFRSMQLESSVFGVCAVQLKPQLELLLGLPQFSLTKEIKLTQDLLSLFIDYQISSDLLSFDGDDAMTSSEKVEVVKGHVAAVYEMIQELKEKDLRNAEQEADMHVEMLGCNSGFSFGGAAPAPRGGGMFGDMFGSAAPAPQAVMAFSAAAPLPQDYMACAAAPAPQASVAFGAPAPVPVPRSAELSATKTRLSVKPKGQAQSDLTKTDASQLYKDSKNLDETPQNSKSVDFTLIPKKLDAKFEALDTDSALRPTVIKTGDVWTKRMQQNLLTKMHEVTLTPGMQKKERNKAFDLLDALSRSGPLPIACAELHVFVAATHCFENSLMATVIQDNINPIEKMEKSMLIVASTIFDLSPAHLLKNEQEEERVVKYSPALFE